MKTEQEAIKEFEDTLYYYVKGTNRISGETSNIEKSLLNSLYALIDLRINRSPQAPRLKTLEEHNSERYKVHNSYSSRPRPNGIACPKCGSELVDSDPSTQLASNPPQKNINCPSCNYIGYRIA